MSEHKEPAPLHPVCKVQNGMIVCTVENGLSGAEFAYYLYVNGNLWKTLWP